MSRRDIADELDQIARDGFDGLREAVGPNPPEGALERGKLVLQAIGKANGRHSSENNLHMIGFQIGKAIGLPPEELRTLWDGLGFGSASADAHAQTGDPLAGMESASSKRRARKRPKS